MSKLTIVAHIHANPDKIDLVKAELEKLLPITRAEEGCIQYDLHQNKMRIPRISCSTKTGNLASFGSFT